MDNTWTQNQQAAIERRGGLVMVSAAAGSGKTSVLVQRIIELLTDSKNPVDADKLLVVTFTNAAAAEMSARIKKKLEELAAENPGDAVLRRQVFLLGRAQISTVHSFCVSLLRDNFGALDIPVDFTLADDAVAAELRQRALERTMDALYADKTSGIEALCELFGKSRTDRDTAALIGRLYEFETNLAFPKDWEARLVAELEKCDKLAESAAGQYLLSHAESLACSARDMVSEALEICTGDDALSTAYTPALESDFVFANKLLAHITAQDWDSALETSKAYNPKRLGSVKEDESGLKSAAQHLRNKAKDVFKALAEQYFICSEDEYKRDIARIIAPTRALFGAVALFEKTLIDIKLERRTLEFCDLERLAVQLLCGKDGLPTETARQISERFEHILIDEYQDTNEIQDLIFSLVSRGEKNLFFVGDIKQSIYGFRRADPEIFSRRRAACHDNETGLFPAKIVLAHNFRSSLPVIKAINNIFLPIMTKKTGGTDYAAPGEQLLARDGAYSTGDTGLDLRLVVKETEDAEPRYVAKTVATMLREGYPIEDKDGPRPCRESDFCILLRSSKDRAKKYVSALKSEGVRCWTDVAANLFNNSEIAVMISLLKIIDNPKRDIELAAVMMSPLFGFDADDLVRLRMSDRRASLYSLLLSSGDLKAANFLHTIKELREKRNSLPVGRLIQYAADILGAEIALCAGTEYSVRRDNIRLLIEYSDGFAASSGGSLSSFLRVCDSAAQGKSSIKRSFAPPSDAVCITTVHKSKGLEWPVVIVVNAEKQFNQSDSRDPTMLFDSALGTGSKMRTETADGSALFLHKTLNYAALSLHSREKTVSEEMRVMYVGLTRARQKLIVTAAVKDPEKTLESWRVRALRVVGYSAATARSWLDWIGLSAASASDAFTESGTQKPVVAGAISLDIIDEVYESEASAVPRIPISDTKVKALIAAINKRAGFVNPRRALSDIPGKLSVTDIAKDRSPAVLYRPSFSRETVSAVERGNAIHIFMQCADYERAAVSVEAELKRLVDGAYIDRESAAEIKTAKLRTFFESDLGKKVANGGKNVLREYAFIDTIDASKIKENLPLELARQKIMLQGIADCIILEPDGAVLVDYKSDKVTEPNQLVERYRAQLDMYKAALDTRLPVPVKSSVIYSFELGEAIEIQDNLVHQ